MTTEISIEALVDEFERCSNEVALSGYGHEFDPGKRYKQEARDEALTDLMRAINNLRASATASEKQAARMRWIESHAVRLASPHMNGAHEYHVTMAFHKLRGPSFAAAIDAAMEKVNG